ASASSDNLSALFFASTSMSSHFFRERMLAWRLKDSSDLARSASRTSSLLKRPAHSTVSTNGEDFRDVSSLCRAAFIISVGLMSVKQCRCEKQQNQLQGLQSIGMCRRVTLPERGRNLPQCPPPQMATVGVPR